ncbi:MAG: DDE-type integrase/transposase/recombinase [Solirubrobacteraceae bacterium]
MGDFTHVRCWEGVVYFSFVLDVFSRMIVGWQLAANMRTTLVLDALRLALGLRAPAGSFLHSYKTELISDRVSGKAGRSSSSPPRSGSLV